MNKKLTLITSAFMAAAVSASICSPAMAATTNTETNESEVANIDSGFLAPENSSVITELAASTMELATVKVPLPFTARVVVTDSAGSQVFDVADQKQTLEEILDSHNLDITDFRSEDDVALKDNYTLKSNEDLALFKSEISGTSKIVKLKAPTEKKETDELFEGETKVSKKGKDGEALETVIKTHNLAADKKVNASAEETQEVDSVEEKLTILKAPEAEVILVGTKKKSTASSWSASQNQSVSTVSNYNTSSKSSSNGSTKSSRSSSNTNSIDAAEAYSNNARGGNTVKSSYKSNNVSDKSSTKKSAADKSISSLIRSQVGKPYVWGATGPSAFDCSGLIYWAFTKSNGYSVPRTSTAQWHASSPVSVGNIQPGDILWKPGHIAIYVGDGDVVHASSPATGVKYDSLSGFLSRGYSIGRF